MTEVMLRPSRTKGRKATLGVIEGRFAISVGLPSLPEPKGWRWMALSEIADLESGHTPSRKHPEYWGGTTPWISIADAVAHHGQTIQDTIEHVSDEGLAHSSARLLPANTVCLSRTASVGYVVVMGCPMATSQDFVNWVCGPELEPDYLKYVLLAERESILRFATGTTHQTMYYPEAKALHVLLPPLSEQRQILDVLRPLDAKIGANRRMNDTLEAIGRSLYRSWFVDFDPVRAKAEGRDTDLPEHISVLFPNSFVEADVGRIPQGWRRDVVGAHALNFDSQRIPVSSSERAKRSGQYPYYGAASAMGNIDGYLFDGTYLLVGEDGSVVRNGGLAVTQYVWGKFWVNNHAHVLQGNDPITTEHLYLYFQFEPVAPWVTGAVQPKLSQGRMNSMPFVFPGTGLSRAFADTVQPMFDRLRRNVDEIRTLDAMRTLLLPKLLSGDRRVVNHA